MPHNPGPFLTPELRAFFVPENGELPGFEHPAVDHNIQMLYSPEFTQELSGGTFVGKAGFEFLNDSESVSCAGVNAYAEPETGRIVTFGNEQYVDRNIVDANSRISFKVGMSRETFQIMIVGFFAAGSLTGEGKAVLGGTIEAYNFESDMVARDEQQRQRLQYGDIGSIAISGAVESEMSPVRKYSTNRLFRRFRR